MPLEVVREVASGLDAPVHRLADEFPTFFDENNAVALKAASLLPDFSISDELRDQAFAVNPPCRLEKVPSELSRDHEIWLDIGHNEAAIKTTFETIRTLYPDHAFTVLLGTSKQKDL